MSPWASVPRPIEGRRAGGSRVPQVWAERDPGLHPLAACTACKLQLQWEFRETALHQPSTAFGELIPSLAPCSGCQPGKRQGKGIHPPRAGKGGLKEKGEGKGDRTLFQSWWDGLRQAFVHASSWTVPWSSVFYRPRPGDLRTQGTKEEGRCKLTHWGMLQRQEAPQAHTLPRVET